MKRKLLALAAFATILVPLGAVTASAAITHPTTHPSPKPAVAQLAAALNVCPGWSTETTTLTDSPIETEAIGIPEPQYVFAFATLASRPITLGSQPTGVYAPYASWTICWRLQGTDPVGNYGLAALWNNGTDSWWTNPASAGGPYVGLGRGGQFAFQCTARFGSRRFWLSTPGQYASLAWMSGYPGPVEHPGGPSNFVDDFTANGPFCS